MAKDYAKHKPELSVGKKAHDWTVRYRRAGRTLVTLMPEPGAFCVLVVLGGNEDGRARGLKLSANVAAVLRGARKYHDGRWLWIRPRTKSDLASVRRLLEIKREPDRA